MLNPRSVKRKYLQTVSYKEPLTDISDSDIDQHAFHSSTSKFNYVEEEALKIEVLPTDKDSFYSIILQQDVLKYKSDFFTDENVPQYIKDLYLDNIHTDDIKIFNPKKHNDLSETLSSFLIKLRLVLENNARMYDVTREERFIDDMAIELMKIVKYDDGKFFTMRPCSLKLVIDDKSFAAEADREGRRGLRIIWILQENKHIDDTRYSEGDVQLVSCMIAAYQNNFRTTKELCPKTMIGIKIKGEEVYFYSMKMTEQYLTSLSKGIPTEHLKINKYPPKKGLRISDPNNRKEILKFLWIMRENALNIPDED